jgi:SepF-like predicted cell division protein (DUF552 family)
MKTTKEDWELKLKNLHSRTKGITSEHQIDYKRLLSKVKIGNSVLDVGCGTCWLKNYLPLHTEYVGIDSFVKGKEVVNIDIEDFCEKLDSKTETIVIFAALDGMRDLVKAIQNIKSIAINNIVILTGVEIEPDLYHTHKITRQFIAEQMDGFTCTYEEYVHPKIVFLEYTKNKTNEYF